MPGAFEAEGSGLDLRGVAVELGVFVDVVRAVTVTEVEVGRSSLSAEEVGSESVDLSEELEVAVATLEMSAPSALVRVKVSLGCVSASS